MKKRLFILLLAFIGTACSEEYKEKNSTITIPDRTELTQTAYADDNSDKNSVNFTTAGAWTSTITETPAVKSASDTIPAWICIDPASGDKAGDYTINITLGTNYTGEKRTATITITCNGQTITITVTQEATTKDGEKPEQPLFVKKINGNDVIYDTVAPLLIFATGIKTVSHYSNKVISHTQWEYLKRYNDTCYYEYNDDNYLIKVRNRGSYYRDKSEYYWKGDTLKYIRGNQQGHPREGYLRSDLEYGSTEYTKGNIDINWMLSANEYYTEIPISAIGIRTTRTNKLIVKKTMKAEDYDDDKYDGYATYRYEFNEAGCIIKIYENRYTPSMGVWGERLIYKFEY